MPGHRAAILRSRNFNRSLTVGGVAFERAAEYTLDQGGPFPDSATTEPEHGKVAVAHAGNAERLEVDAEFEAVE